MQSAPETLTRVKDGWLQLAFVMLRKEQRDMALLATIDLGPQDYFGRIVQLIKKREKRGFAIVYEDLGGVLGLNHENEDDKGLQQLRQTAMAGLREHGIVFLPDVVCPEDYWIKVSAPEMETATDELGAVRDNLAQTLRSIRSDPEATARALQSFPAPREVYELYAVTSANEFAVRVADAMVEQAARYHVFAYVGLHRAPAVIEAMTAAGYRIIQQHWMDVMVVRRKRTE
jgi:hypothetical protein